MNGSNLIYGKADRLIIDFFGMGESEARSKYPKLYQRVADTVRPVRSQVARRSHRENWWIYGEARHGMRKALAGLSRYIGTVETAKHRTFSFLPSAVLPDQKLRVFAIDDAFTLAVLSSLAHVLWAEAAGGRLGVGNDLVYNHSKCFDPFPFPAATEAQKVHLRDLGEQLDTHRKAQQAAHPKLTLTAMYNVLEKLRAGERVEGKDREIYDQGLVGILRDLHDQIDAAVADAYGWPADLSDDEILHRLVDLNRERAAEEARGHVRWLRPEYQNPQDQKAMATGEQGALDIGPKDTATKAPWPKSLPEQIAAVRAALSDLGEATPEQVARQFQRARSGTVQPLLESLSALGQARPTEGGRYAA
jgi:hypothetical protein